jgi:hypothetical protein
VFLSARPEHEMLAAGQRGGADFYIVKPVDPIDIGSDLYFLFERNFDMNAAEALRLRVARKVPRLSRPPAPQPRSGSPRGTGCYRMASLRRETAAAKPRAQEGLIRRSPHPSTGKSGTMSRTSAGVASILAESTLIRWGTRNCWNWSWILTGALTLSPVCRVGSYRLTRPTSFPAASSKPSLVLEESPSVNPIGGSPSVGRLVGKLLTFPNGPDWSLFHDSL